MQKLIAVLGVLAIAMTTPFAPYDVVGYDEIARLINGDAPAARWKYEVHAVIHAPMWASPTKKDAETAYFWQDTTRKTFPTVQSVSLATGRLMLWWVGIAIATGAAVVLAAKYQPADRGEAD